jgi:cytochrome c-type biogenesis protein CcmH
VRSIGLKQIILGRAAGEDPRTQPLQARRLLGPRVRLRRPEDDKHGRIAQRQAALLIPLALLLAAAASNDPADRLPDPRQEAHARALFRDIRCLVCQNQSIDESDAGLAEDLRRIVRRQVAAGRSDAEIKRYLVDRYGDFVLERPAFSPGNAILWGAPFAIVLIGGAAVLMRRRAAEAEAEAAPLSDAEKAKLTEISSALD